MQDVQSSINGGEKVLLRRLNHNPPPQQVAAFNNYLNHQPLSYPHLQPPQPHQAAALKCPRCDSLNTKFCYYNNYNLSQPRHFCKNCRRYWTKGGVLRNVPVGGGCRKSKKSSKSKSPPSSHTISPTPTTNASISSTGGNNDVSQTRDLGLSSSHSSNESRSNATLFQIPDMDNLETNTLFSDDVENFMRIDNNNNNDNNNSNIQDNSSNNNSTVSRVVSAEAASFTEYLRNQEWEMGKIIRGVQQDKIDRSTAVDLVDVGQTVRIEDFLQNRGGTSALDWNPTADNNQVLFDVGDDSTVDHHDYWGQSTTAVDHHQYHHHHDPQWSDSTTGHLPLFLP